MSQERTADELRAAWEARPTYHVWDRKTGAVRPALTNEEGREYMRTVPRTLLQSWVGTLYVSTVFLGIDHSRDVHGPPVLWETLVWGGPLDGDGERYLTEDAARAGHAEWVSRVAAAAIADIPDDPPELSI